MCGSVQRDRNTAVSVRADRLRKNVSEEPVVSVRADKPSVVSVRADKPGDQSIREK